MISAIVGLMILVVVLGVLFWGIQQLLPLIPMAEPFRTILRVLTVFLVAFIAIYFILQILGMAGIHVQQFGRM